MNLPDLVPFEPSGHSAADRAAIKGLLVRALTLVLHAWRDRGMLGEAPMVVRLGTDTDARELVLELHRDELTVRVGDDVHVLPWDVDDQVERGLADLMAVRRSRR
ncbi:MAG: hypothetical protein KF718_16805 [Polyangiaceae bacterium]|nr:hypothetical protein [Polyangiaceae bacterium]